MTESLCRWCHESLADHREESAPMARMPCGGRKSGFAAVQPAIEPAPAPMLFRKPMTPSSRIRDEWSLRVGPFNCLVMPAVGLKRGQWWWAIEHSNGANLLVSDYEPTTLRAVVALEKALTDIETSIREARGA